MAGIDKEYQGEAWAAEGAKVGYLEQEPQLNGDKDVFGNVMEGVAEKRPAGALQRVGDELFRRDGGRNGVAARPN